jgi:hypothetical protein
MPESAMKPAEYMLGRLFRTKEELEWILSRA